MLLSYIKIQNIFLSLLVYFLRLIGGCQWKEMRVKICLICLKKGLYKYSCLRSGIYLDMTLYASWIFKSLRHAMGIISLFSNIFLILDINESINTTNCIKYNFIHQTHQNLTIVLYVHEQKIAMFINYIFDMWYLY